MGDTLTNTTTVIANGKEKPAPMETTCWEKEKSIRLSNYGQVISITNWMHKLHNIDIVFLNKLHNISMYKCANEILRIMSIWLKHCSNMKFYAFVLPFDKVYFLYLTFINVGYSYILYSNTYYVTDLPDVLNVSKFS